MKHDVYKKISELRFIMKILNNAIPQTEKFMELVEKLEPDYSSRDYISFVNNIRKLCEGSVKTLLGNYNTEKAMNKLLEDLDELRKGEPYSKDHLKSDDLLILSNYLRPMGSHCNKSAHQSSKEYNELEIDLLLSVMKFVLLNILKFFDIKENVDNDEYAYKYKHLGNILTKMIPIFPCRKNYEISSEDICFKYDVMEIFSDSSYYYEFETINEYILSKSTVYNEAKPMLLDYDIKRSEEDDRYYIEMNLGICGYHDFLAINRNLDVLGNGSIRQKISNASLSELMAMNVPKSLGISSILITKDDFVVFQKRNKSEVASNMYHVTVAEGLSVSKSYNDFIEMNKNKRKNSIVDTNIKNALLRGIKEEIGLEENSISDMNILSIYFDEELMQPIFQSCAYIKLTKNELESLRLAAKGIDTLCEIKEFIYVKNDEEPMVHYLKETVENEGVWSTHAIINLISYLEFISEKETLVYLVNRYFTDEFLFSLGRQNFIETLLSKNN